MIHGWTFVVDALAVYRLSRLIVRDEITRRFREAELRLGEWVLSPGYFLTCEWCLAVWFGGAAVALTYLTTWWPYAASALALSAVSGILSERT